jgi:ribosomal protein S18 acetylase RimI-like enzyme
MPRVAQSRKWRFHPHEHGMFDDCATTRGRTSTAYVATRSPYPLSSPAVSDATFIVRKMTAADLSDVGKLAGKLVRMHHDLDPRRFLELANPEAGYARFLGSELKSKNVVLLVAERTDGKAVVGYTYARLEGRNYNDLLEACGKLHDVYVDESARGQGIGEALVTETMRQLTEKGAPRVVLLTATQNEAAQRLFKKLGFRTTMLEMTREADADV